MSGEKAEKNLLKDLDKMEYPKDVDKIKHRYPMYGTLDPYLTLFMPASDYASLGYLDATELAKKCVEARVSYKQSRNPVIRRLKNA